MKVLIDTNVILDVLCNRTEFLEASVKIFKLCEVKKLSGCISALSVPNIMYIMRKELDAQKIKDVFEKLSLIFEITDLKAIDLEKAANMGFEDYEDAIQSACASRIHADYIVTRNTRDFMGNGVEAIRPVELLERL